ncbi:MAG: T9SS C-terminal target domain-containing protein, partial [Bacteroidetes bacterium]
LVTYPNPADNFVNVLFRLEEPADVRLSLYDLQGRLVRQLPPLTKALGEQSHRIDVRTLPSGTYELVLDIEGQRFTRRVVRK